MIEVTRELLSILNPPFRALRMHPFLLFVYLLAAGSSVLAFGLG